MNCMIAKSLCPLPMKKLQQRESSYNYQCYNTMSYKNRNMMGRPQAMLRPVIDRVPPLAGSLQEDHLLDYITQLISPGNYSSRTRSFIQRYRGKTIVVKYGGAPMNSQELQASVINDIVLLFSAGLHIVLVHGGGPHIDLLLRKLNMEPLFINGDRVTNKPTLEAVAMVLMGKVNPSLVTLINKYGATAVGLSGMDGRLLTVRPSPDAATLGYVGDIVSVDPSILCTHTDKYHIPVVAPLAAEGDQMYNINADTVAGELAVALGAEKLILLTDVPGILENSDDPKSLVKEIDIKGVEKMKEDGKIGGGMIPKVNCCVRCLAQGVKTASIIDGRLKHSLLREILTHEGAGTMIVG